MRRLWSPAAGRRSPVGSAAEKSGCSSQTAVHYPVPVHLKEAYATLGYERGGLPHTEHACERVPEMTAE